MSLNILNIQLFNKFSKKKNRGCGHPNSPSNFPFMRYGLTLCERVPSPATVAAGFMPGAGFMHPMPGLEEVERPLSRNSRTPT